MLGATSNSGDWISESSHKEAFWSRRERLLQERSSPRQFGVLPSANASMSHEDRKLGMAENVIGNAPGQRLSKRALRVGSHHKKVGVKSCCLVEDYVTQATASEFSLNPSGKSGLNTPAGRWLLSG